jgi:fibro-slime domain-containing protein
LISAIRDFADPYGAAPADPSYRRHPDFELQISGNHLETGLVLAELGPDDKPVYAPRDRSTTTTGAMNFDQWYRDTPGVNQTTTKEFQLQPSAEDPGLYVYSSNSFFPIDGELLGNQGRTHNFGFTLETSFDFRYIGGEVFRFKGDDDLWVFINRRLAIDLGGLHRSLEGSVELDQRAAQLGIRIGETYPLHLFFAERHTLDSNFSVETTIADPGTCD